MSENLTNVVWKCREGGDVTYLSPLRQKPKYIVARLFNG